MAQASSPSFPTEAPPTCLYCRGNIVLADYFCPHCGKKLREKPLATNLARQIYIYLLSLLLPPLGLWPAIKYLRQQDEKSKKIGLAALVLTIISLLAAIWLSMGFINSLNQKFSNQFTDYQEILNY